MTHRPSTPVSSSSSPSSPGPSRPSTRTTTPDISSLTLSSSSVRDPAHPARAEHAALLELAASIRAFGTRADEHLYAAPVIDWHAPRAHRQNGITGLQRFEGTVVRELEAVEAVSASAPPGEINSNLVYLRAVWDEVVAAPLPLVGICPFVEHAGVQVKVDVVCKGGDEWVKVNTVKESRLLAEFHEQDSYINSDYDSDDGSEHAPAELTNSVIKQAQALVASACAVRPANPPTVRMVLTRLSPDVTYADSRIAGTFDALRSLGVVLAFGPRTPPPIPPPRTLVPSLDVVLDLSIVIALCCDTSHAPLPRDDAELEARYRPPKSVSVDGAVRLAAHTTTTSDLRDQLRAEMAHPLVPDLVARLAQAQATARARGVADPQPVFWVTQEVKDRLPALVDIMGGESERARARALFGEGGDFWHGSRHDDPGLLRDIRIHILDPADRDGEAPGVPAPRPSPPPPVEPETAFDRAVLDVCDKFLDPTFQRTLLQPTRPRPARGKRLARAPGARRESPSLAVQGLQGSPGSRLPSEHTVRTMRAAAARAATLLTNNRGAVGKVLREVGVWTGAVSGAATDIERAAAAEREGEGEGQGQVERARIWVVHPSSLAEWRRREVEDAHRAALANARNITPN
ncbi:hypothetical protein Q5752_002252 [Cryptotrichosporon argae]